ncbi:MAG: pilus assembly protein TadG-related protein [Stellaceae bacterium]
MRACGDGANPRGAAWQGLWRDRRGVVAILLALALPMMIGLAGLGVETGLWYAMKWQNQSAADAAAMSAALELGNGKGCLDYSQMAVYAAKYSGFTPTSSSFPCPVSGSNCTTGVSSICVNTPPQSGSQTCADAPTTCNNAVEVILSQQQNTFLAAFYLSAVTIQSRSVALWGSGGTVCVLALDPSAAGAVDILSGASVNLTNCWVAANSTSATSIITAGTGTPACPPGTTGLCAYDLWTAGNYGSAGITLSRPPAVTYNYPVVDTYNPWQAKIRATQPSGASCKRFGPVATSTPTLPGHLRLHFANTAGIAAGMPVFDATSPAVIPAGTTVAAGGVNPPDVTMTNAATGAGVASGDEIYFGSSLSPGVAYCAPVGLTSGTYSLAAGVYYIYGESPASTYFHHGTDLQGIAFFVADTAAVSGSGATIVVYGDSSTHQAGSFDINCSFPFTTGNLMLSPPAASTASIPAGLLFYQDPLFADTGGGAGHGSAPCQNHGSRGPPNTASVGSGVTLSSASVIYTPASELDFSGSSSGVCTILDADLVVLGLFGATALSYPASSCSTLSPSTTVAASLAE